MNNNFSQYRTSDMEHKLEIANFYPLDVMVTGVTGAGKSSTLNALFEKIVATVGDGVDPETMELDTYRLNNALRLWDTPGLGDGVEQDIRHQRNLIDLLRTTYCLDNRDYGFIDLALVVIEGSNRDMGTTYRLLNDIIIPNIQSDRIIVAINQADMAMKGRHWDYESGQPDNILREYLDEQAHSVQRRIRETTGVTIRRPVCYSAQYGYGLHELFDTIVDQMPVERRSLAHERHGIRPSQWHSACMKV